MQGQNYKKMLLSLLGAGLMVSGMTSPLCAIEEQKSGMKAVEEEFDIETTVQGTIDRIGDSDVVIGDTLYSFAPGSNLSKSSFAEGQYVLGEVDKQRHIYSLQRISAPASTKKSHKNSSSATNVLEKPVDKQELIIDGGVWKNKYTAP